MLTILHIFNLGTSESIYKISDLVSDILLTLTAMVFHYVLCFPLKLLVDFYVCYKFYSDLFPIY